MEVVVQIRQFDSIPTTILLSHLWYYIVKKSFSVSFHLRSNMLLQLAAKFLPIYHGKSIFHGDSF